MNSQLIHSLLLFVAVVACGYLIYSYNMKQSEPVNTSEAFSELDDDHEKEDEVYDNTVSPAGNAPVESKNLEEKSEVEASQGLGQNEVFASVIGKDSNDGEFGLGENQLPKDCFPKDQLSPNDLLPQDANSKWAQVNPSGQGSVGDQNFLNAGFHTGVNTVGQTLRNPNLQLRSEPPNPQVQVSPWMNTSMEPDTNRRAMEIAGCD